MIGQIKVSFTHIFDYLMPFPSCFGIYRVLPLLLHPEKYNFLTMIVFIIDIFSGYKKLVKFDYIYIFEMEALQAVEKEEKRLRSKIDTCQKNLNKYLDGLIEQVQTLRNDISEGINKWVY